MHGHILRKPVITEKSLNLANTQNVFTFLVDRVASKEQIKQAVADTFKVEVVSVNTVSTQRVQKTTGRKRLKVLGSKTKKALVQLQAGQSIELFDLGGSN